PIPGKPSRPRPASPELKPDSPSEPRRPAVDCSSVEASNACSALEAPRALPNDDDPDESEVGCSGAADLPISSWSAWARETTSEMDIRHKDRPKRPAIEKGPGVRHVSDTGALRRSRYWSSRSTAFCDEFAWASIAVPACCSTCSLVKLTISDAMSTSLM